MFKEFKCQNGHFIRNKENLYKVNSHEEINLGDLVYNNDVDIFLVDEEDDLSYVREHYYKVIKLK